MVPFGKLVIQEYVRANGKSPFGEWFRRLDPVAAAKITVVLEKIEAGNLSNVKPLGEGISEYKLDWGPGYRVYFGKDGATLIILLGGGTKRRQPDDIAEAQSAWTEYKNRKRAEQQRQAQPANKQPEKKRGK